MASGGWDEGDQTLGGVGPPPSGLRRLLAWSPLRLVLYYAGVLGFMLALISLFPGLERALDHERARHVMGGDLSFDGVEQAVTTDALRGLDSMIVICLSSLIALLLSVPVAWVYGWTSRRSSYSKSFAQTLVVFPIAIATVVFLVKGSLALAFSLAGIVAAVRFRNQLRETRDALFLFLVVGIGLAAGVQLLLVALVSSTIFNFALLYVSSTDFGARPPRLQGLMLEERVAKAGAPKRKAKAKAGAPKRKAKDDSPLL